MKHRPVLVPTVVLLALTIVSCSDRGAGPEAGVWQGTVTQEDGVTVVRNSKAPLHEGSILALAEDWTAGKAGPEGSLLSSPESLAVDEAGVVYVLDFRPPYVKVFEADGRFRRAFGRQGQGPGEFQFVERFSLPAGSGRLAVLDIGGKRLNWFDLEGNFLESSLLPMPSLARGGVDSRGRLFWTEGDRQTGRITLVLFDPGTETSVRLHEWPTPDFQPNPFRPRTCCEPDGRGGLIFGDAAAYELLVFDADGTLARRIRREHEPVPVSREDIDEFERRPTPQGISHANNVYSKTHGAFRSFFTDDLGHIFVQTWERTPDRGMDIHDVFDAEGRFIGRTPLPPHKDLINPTLRVLRNGKLYAILPDDEGYEVVKRYSVTWLIE